MSDSEFHDTMSSLQFQGYCVKWFVHAKGHFSKRKGFISQAIAYQVARESGLMVTPDFA